MKTKRIYLLALLAAFGCSPNVVDDPPDGCQSVDYFGNAAWRLTADSLMLDMEQNLDGKLTATVGAETDSGRWVVAVFDGVFTAALGQNEFEKRGKIIFAGNLRESAYEYSVILDVIAGFDGFKDMTGDLDLTWLETDEEIWYGGTFCFPQ